MTILYLLICKANDKRYVGMTSRTLGHARATHKADAKRFHQTGNNDLLVDIAKYGIDAFTYTYIEEVATHLAQQAQEHWIKYFDTLKPKGYNFLKEPPNREHPPPLADITIPMLPLSQPGRLPQAAPYYPNQATRHPSQMPPVSSPVQAATSYPYDKNLKEAPAMPPKYHPDLIIHFTPQEYPDLPYTFHTLTYIVPRAHQGRNHYTTIIAEEYNATYNPFTKHILFPIVTLCLDLKLTYETSSFFHYYAGHADPTYRNDSLFTLLLTWEELHTPSAPTWVHSTLPQLNAACDTIVNYADDYIQVPVAGSILISP